MRVSYNWLKNYVDLTLPPAELAERLTARGVVVETLMYANPGVEGVLIGKVAEIARHPNADTLWVCQVELGGRTLQILTGAQNVRQGDLVPAAVPGSKIPGKTLAVANLRGLDSHGMLCSPEELGIDEGGEGILILPPDPDVEPGMDAAEVLGLNDWILELDLTANYASHCQSMVGVAQEVSAILETAVTLPETFVEEAPNTDVAKLIDVRIEAPDLCDRYVARVVRGVKVGPSPAWLQARLRAAGMRPINNIVDVSNFVMLEMGQPLHTFDFTKIAGKEIIVRRARPGETMVTLDEQTRTLDPDILVIADRNGPVAIAGVMGGLDSEVTAETADILIESAHFDNINNRRMALRMNLPSEAARRFTKGVDPSGAVPAADRAALLIGYLAGGTAVAGHVDNYPRPTVPPVIRLRTAKVNGYLGLQLTMDRMAEHLTRLGMVVLSPSELAMDLAAGYPEAEEEEGDDLGGRPVWTAVHQVSAVPLDPEAYAEWAKNAWSQLEEAGQRLDALGDEEALVVVVPTRRLDIAVEIDLVEEIARSEGYESIPAVLPVLATARGGRSPKAELVRSVRRSLSGAGLDEVLMHSLVHPRVYDKLQLPEDSPHRRYLSIANPMYEDRSTLRTTLVPGLLDALQHNVNRQVRDVAIFEIGTVYQPQEGQQLPDEPHMLGLAIMGSPGDAGWNRQTKEADFFTIKGMVERLLQDLNVATWAVARGGHAALHPGRQALLIVDGIPCGGFGELHPTVADAWGLPGRVYVAELDLETVLESVRALRDYRPVPRFPAVSRDLALVVSDTVPAASVVSAIRSAGGELLEDAALFDLYQGEHVKGGHRSLAYRLTYRSPDRTLTDADVESVHGQVRAAVQAIGAELRS